jgi:hypothetical protein
MDKILISTKNILQKYEYLHYNSISELIKKDWVFEKDIKNPEDILNNLILEDIKTNWINSTFIQVWLGYYALRKSSEEENLFSYISCRLRNFAFWQIDKHDLEYSEAIFGKDLFNSSNFFQLLDNLKNNWKITSYTPIIQGQIIMGVMQK